MMDILRNIQYQLLYLRNNDSFDLPTLISQFIHQKPHAPIPFTKHLYYL